MTDAARGRRDVIERDETGVALAEIAARFVADAA